MKELKMVLDALESARNNKERATQIVEVIINEDESDPLYKSFEKVVEMQVRESLNHSNHLETITSYTECIHLSMLVNTMHIGITAKDFKNILVDLLTNQSTEVILSINALQKLVKRHEESQKKKESLLLDELTQELEKEIEKGKAKDLEIKAKLQSELDEYVETRLKEILEKADTKKLTEVEMTYVTPKFNTIVINLVIKDNILIINFAYFGIDNNTNICSYEKELNGESELVVYENSELSQVLDTITELYQ